MSGSGGVWMARARGENRFYVSPAIRKQQQRHKPLNSKDCTPEVEKRVESDQCVPSNCTVSGRTGTQANLTNFDRFLEHTIPVVPAQSLPKKSNCGWRTPEQELQPYFFLGDLWEFFKEWSAYGAGVPLLLNGSETVMQYYVPYLSAIQLYIDPSRPSPRLRRPGEESDAESSRETSSDDSSDYGSNHVLRPRNHIDMDLNKPSLRNKASEDSSSDECEISKPTDRLIFEYMEHESPFTRQPLADKISILASYFPELKTYRSCDLSPTSWISVAWYPIYRIPVGPTLQNLDACFLTFHSLSTAHQSQNSDGMHLHASSVRDAQCANMSFKLPLRTFGLAAYKFKASFWDPNEIHRCQKFNSLLRAAENWLRRLQANHPDYSFFVSNNSNRR